MYIGGIGTAGGCIAFINNDKLFISKKAIIWVYNIHIPNYNCKMKIGKFMAYENVKLLNICTIFFILFSDKLYILLLHLSLLNVMQ